VRILPVCLVAVSAACTGGDTEPPPCSTADAPALSGPWFEEAPNAFPGGAMEGLGRVSVVDIDGDGIDDLVGTAAHDGQHGLDPFTRRVMRGRGDGTFEDITARTGLDQARGGLLLFGDVDDDGDQDAFVGHIHAPGQSGTGLWRNDGTGAFEPVADSGLALQTLGCGGQTCVSAQLGAAFADLDQDGRLDLYVGAWAWHDGQSDTRYTPPGRDQLWQGQGDGTFVDRSAQLPAHPPPHTDVAANFGRQAMGVATGDWDNDGDVDVFVANYGAGRPFGPFEEPLCSPPRYWDHNLLWRTDPGWTFVDVAPEVGAHATLRGAGDVREETPVVMDPACPAEVQGTYPSPIGGNHFSPMWGDFDNDGDLDLVVGSIAHPDYPQSDPTLLLINQGPPTFTFTEEAAARGLVYREDEKHAAFVDLDADGRLDLITTGFRAEDENELRVYHQQPDHTFVLLDAATLGATDDSHQEGIALLDADRDGDLDLYIAEDTGPGRLLLNRAADSRATAVLRLEGEAIRDATGARITATTSAGTLLREVQAFTGHYDLQPTREVHLGLGGDTCATDVSIRWPDGTTESLGEVRAGRWQVRRGAGVVSGG
jgi:enediyne biosynthesis protein E4